MLRRRKECPAFGTGDVCFIDSDQPAVLAHRCELDSTTVFSVHNFARRKTRCHLPVGEAGAAGSVHDVLSGRRHDVQDGHCRIDLEPFGYRWLMRGPA